MELSSITVALVGNPNTGKSTLFNALTGLRQHVGNYPGVTVDLKEGWLEIEGKAVRVIDLPGTYSLAPRSPDEMVSVELLLGERADIPRPDVIISIVDASNLERHLYLTTQLMDIGVPLIVAINLIDVAKQRGITFDVPELGRRLGCPVVLLQANQGIGIPELRKTIIETASNGSLPPQIPFPAAFDHELTLLGKRWPHLSRFHRQRLMLDIGGYTEAKFATKLQPDLTQVIEIARKRLAEAGCPVPAVEAKARYGWIRQVLEGIVQKPTESRASSSDRIDRILTHRIWGTIFFLGLMFLVFQAIFVGAIPLMESIDAVKEWMVERVASNMSAGPLRSLITDGVLKGVGGVLVFLPQIMILFGFIAILEDCGYMARAAFLMDKVMSKCGLNGKSFIPLLSSVACAVPGIMATRVIENRRDRLATILVAPLMSCSARLPLYMLLIGVFLQDPWWLPGLVLFGMYMVGFVTAPLVALTLKSTLLRGTTPLFVMEMPAYRWPQLRSVLRRMSDAGRAFVSRAGTLILASMVLVWAMLYFPAGIPELGTARATFERINQDFELLVVQSVPVDGGSTDFANLATHHDLLQTTQKEFSREFHEGSYDRAIDCLEQLIQRIKPEAPEDGSEHPLDETVARMEGWRDALSGDWKRQSYLGQVGQAMEGVFRPLGWDWKIGMAALASFPAREVVVGTLGIVYDKGDVDPKEIRQSPNPGDTPLGRAVRQEWERDPIRSRYRIPVAVGLMVFFALCCQCVSTLAVIRRETASWSWPLFTFVYMTVLAYVAAFLVFQVGKGIIG